VNELPPGRAPAVLDVIDLDIADLAGIPVGGNFDRDLLIQQRMNASRPRPIHVSYLFLSLQQTIDRAG
jgi:hypothetical protein